jgi:hypothetical protein
MDCLDEECPIFSVNDIAAYVHALETQKPELFPRFQELVDHLEGCIKCRKTIALQIKLQGSADSTDPKGSAEPKF